MIGVVGSGPAAERIAAAAREAGGTPRVGDAQDVIGADPAAVIAVGEASLLDAVRAGLDAPVLPVDAGPGLASLAPDRAPAAARAVVAGEYTTRSHPVLSIRVAGEPVGRAVFDAMLVTSEPARISEYAVESGEPLAGFRADGVVAATPAGSYGYARHAGGPLLAPAAEAVAVVPVAAFAIRSDAWVVDLDDPLALTVERAENAVELLIDDRSAGEVPPGEPVEIERGGRLETILPPGGQLEKL